MAEFICNDDSRIFKKLYEDKKIQVKNADGQLQLTKPSANPIVTARWNSTLERLEVIKVYTFKGTEEEKTSLAECACNELNIMLHLQNPNINATCCAKLYGWRLLDHNGNELDEREADKLLNTQRRNAITLFLNEISELEITMEYGVPLGAFMDEAVKAGVQQPKQKITALFQALEALHSCNVIHQDIKPGNLILAYENHIPVPKFIDFDVSSPFHARSPYVLHNGDTNKYRSPEQAHANPFDRNAVNAENKAMLLKKTDVYSMAVISCELLGISLPEISSQEDWDKRDAFLKNEMKSDLDSILARALARLPEDRLTAGGVLRALGETSTSGAASQESNKRKKPPLRKVMGIILLVFVLCAAAFALFPRDSQSEPNESSQGSTASTEQTTTTSTTTEPETGSCGEHLIWAFSDSTLTISGTGEMTNWSNASSVPWRSWCSTIRSVMISDGVTSIGDYAFYECAALTTIMIPESVTGIGVQAFALCDNLTSITIQNPECEISNASADTLSSTAVIYGYTGSTAEQYAEQFGRTFVALDDKTTVTTPADPVITTAATTSLTTAATTITTADHGTENGFSYQLKNGGAVITDYVGTASSVRIPDTLGGAAVIGIDANVFENHKEITDIQFPNTLTFIGEAAFKGCQGLTDIQLPEALTNIGAYAFQNSVTGEVQFPDGTQMKVIPESAFYGSLMTKIVIPEGIQQIHAKAFAECSGLTLAVLPKTLTYIGERAFYNSAPVERILGYCGNSYTWENDVELGKNAIDAATKVQYMYGQEFTE